MDLSKKCAGRLKFLIEQFNSLLGRPIAKYQEMKRIIRRYKTEVRQFAIALPGKVKEKILEVLERYNSKLLAYRGLTGILTKMAKSAFKSGI